MSADAIAARRFKNIHLPAAVFCLLGFAVNIYAFYPGFISPDSLDQYQQAVSHRFSDWHPPIMAGLWSLLLHIHKGAAPMLVMQLLFYWLACYLLTATIHNYYRKLAWLIPLFFAAPFMQNFVGNIWKDVGLAISWLLAVAMLLKAFFDGCRLTRPEAVITLLLLSYGCWIRFNALPGVAPLLCFWLFSLKRHEAPSLPFKKLLLPTLGLTGILLLAQLSITALFLKPMRTHPEYKLFAHDLTGIYKETGKLYFPAFIMNYPGFDTLFIKEKYIHSTFDNIWWNSEGKRILPDPSEEQMDELQSCWLKAIAKHPLAYAKNRFLGCLDFLRITDSGSKLTITFMYVEPNTLGLTFKEPRLAILLRSGIENQRVMPYMQPWFWALLNVVLLVMAYRPRFAGVKLPVLCLLYSSLFYLLLEFVVYQADTEFRYFYWNCGAVSLALILLLVQAKKRASTEEGS